METTSSNLSLYFLIGGIVLIGILALLYRRFYKSEGTDELNWVNKSNYNIASSEEEVDTIENSSPAEAAEIAHKMTDGDNPVPPSEQEFYALNDKLGGAGNTDEVKDALRHPEG